MSVSKPSLPLRSVAPKLPEGILYGGDYNPEQWPEEVWLEDARLMQEAGVNFVSLAIFSWAKLEPRPGVFEFGWLDRVIDLLWKHGVSVNLATATASPPPWLSRAHPDSLPVDENGVRLSPGARQHYCLNSKAYRERSAELCRQLGRRYAQHPAVALWHINNEIGCHTHACYCDVCATEFRVWLKSRYTTLDALNEAWNTAFWSQIYGDWEEILPPRKAPTFRNPGQMLDYFRFMDVSMQGILRGEIEALRSVAPDAKVTTNGLSFWKQTNYHEWYRDVDIAAWDSYPDPAGGLGEVRTAAFCHDLFRSLRGGQPFILMEQVTSQVNWRANNALKAPGQMRALSYQAIARGADGVMFFQWRASKAGAERFHGAMLPHYGPEGRVFREVRELGAELRAVADVVGARVLARVAMIVSWPNRWALELEAKPAQFDYATILAHFYRPLWELNVPVDIVPPDGELASYDVVIAPALYQLSGDDAARLRRYVERGGCLIMTYFSGVADLREHIWPGGNPALLHDVFGLAVEEWQPLQPGQTQRLRVGESGRETTCSQFCELLDLRGAKAEAVYLDSFCAGRAAITSHCFGHGEARYVATSPDASYLREHYSAILQSRGILAPVEAPHGVEVVVRRGESAEYLFVINHEAQPVQVQLGHWQGPDLLTGDACRGSVPLPSYGVRVIRRPA